MPRHPPCALSSLTLRQALSAIPRPHIASKAIADAITDRALFEKLSATRAVFCCEGATALPRERSRPVRRPARAIEDDGCGTPRRLAGMSRWRRGFGGAGGIRTPDIRLAKAALSQLSYGPRTRQPSVARAGRHHDAAPAGRGGGPSWIRTRDLSLIRTAL